MYFSSTSLQFTPSAPQGLNLFIKFALEKLLLDPREIWLGIVTLAAQIAQANKNERQSHIPHYTLPLSRDWLVLVGVLGSPIFLPFSYRRAETN